MQIADLNSSRAREPALSPLQVRNLSTPLISRPRIMCITRKYGEGHRCREWAYQHSSQAMPCYWSIPRMISVRVDRSLFRKESE
jgi:hypothetical protein